MDNNYCDCTCCEDEPCWTCTTCQSACPTACGESGDQCYGVCLDFDTDNCTNTATSDTGGGDYTCSSELISLDLGGNIDWYDAISDFVFGDGTSGVELGASTGSGTSSCDVCSSAHFGVSAWLTIDANLINQFGVPYYGDFNGDMSISGSVSSEFCGSETICSIISGYAGEGDSSCQVISYGMDYWIPTSCDATADYNAIELGYEITYAFACCSDGNLCNDNYFGDDDDTSSCDDVSSLGSYVDGMVSCWTDIQVQLATYLFCNTIGTGLTNFKDTCIDSDSGEWDSTLTDCAYQLTCNDDFIEFLEEFGTCACAAANANGYPGDLISMLLEILWQEYCGDITLTCSDNGGLLLNIVYYNINMNIVLSGGIDTYESDNIQNDIMLILTGMGNVNSSVVSFTFTESDTSGNVDMSVEVRTQSQDSSTIIYNTYTGGDDFANEWNAVQTSLSGDLSDESSSIIVVRLENASLVVDNTTSTGSGSQSDSTTLFTTKWVRPNGWDWAAIMTANDTTIVIFAILMPVLLAAGFGLYWHFKQTPDGKNSESSQCEKLRCC